MRVRSAVVAAAMALVGLSTPGQAATSDVRLEGTGGRSAPLTVTHDLRLDLTALVPDSRAAWSGVAVRSAAGETLAVSLQVRRWVEGAKAGFVPAPVATHPDLTLRPGRYRLVLLAPGPATVRLPVRGPAPSRLRVTTPAPGVAVQLTDLRTDGLPTGRFRAPVTISAGGLGMLVLHERATAHQLSVPSLCFTAPGALACTPGSDPGTTTLMASPGSAGDGYVQGFYFLWGKWGGAGRHDALVDDLTVDYPRCLDALLVVV